MRILRQAGDEIGEAEMHAVAHRDDAAERNLRRMTARDHFFGDGAGLRDEGHAGPGRIEAAERQISEERGSESPRRIEHVDETGTVRSHDQHVVLLGERAQLRFARLTFGARFMKAARQDEEVAVTGGHALANDVQDEIGAHGDHRQIAGG